MEGLLGFLGSVENVKIGGDEHFGFLRDREATDPLESILLVVSVGGSTVQYVKGTNLANMLIWQVSELTHALRCRCA